MICFSIHLFSYRKMTKTNEILNNLDDIKMNSTDPLHPSSLNYRLPE